jgi:hypothetical protein
LYSGSGIDGIGETLSKFEDNCRVPLVIQSRESGSSHAERVPEIAISMRR